MSEQRLTVEEIAHVRAHVYQAALDVLAPAAAARTVHQAKFSMGFVLALIALDGHAGIADFTSERLSDTAVRAFIDRVEMVLDPEIEAAYPRRWIGYVEVETTDGRRLAARIEEPLGDPGNPLTRDDLADKARLLAAYADGATPAEIEALIARSWTLAEQSDVHNLLTPRWENSARPV